jgi:hypothetical protein
MQVFQNLAIPGIKRRRHLKNSEKSKCSRPPENPKYVLTSVFVAMMIVRLFFLAITVAKYA